jgi:hypothetical protein
VSFWRHDLPSLDICRRGGLLYGTLVCSGNKDLSASDNILVVCEEEEEQDYEITVKTQLASYLGTCELTLDGMI